MALFTFIMWAMAACAILPVVAIVLGGFLNAINEAKAVALVAKFDE